MIRAGSYEEVRWSSESWVFLDVGFSNKKRTCGVLIDDNDPKEMQFDEACKSIANHIRLSSRPVNLVIEAPLSVAFDKDGNPKGRKIEKQDGKTRYWYMGPGCMTMVATQYIMEKIYSAAQNKELRLFEAFVSFKSKTDKSNHSQDVLRLREVVKNPESYSSCIVQKQELLMDETDKLSSAFKVCGRDYNIPPVLRVP